eukprot:1196044-Prorocentrum_minimum.AAC.4
MRIERSRRGRGRRGVEHLIPGLHGIYPPPTPGLRLAPVPMTSHPSQPLPNLGIAHAPQVFVPLRWEPALVVPAPLHRSFRGIVVAPSPLHRSFRWIVAAPSPLHRSLRWTVAAPSGKCYWRERTLPVACPAVAVIRLLVPAVCFFVTLLALTLWVSPGPQGRMYRNAARGKPVALLALSRTDPPLPPTRGALRPVRWLHHAIDICGPNNPRKRRLIQRAPPGALLTTFLVG